MQLIVITSHRYLHIAASNSAILCSISGIARSCKSMSSFSLESVSTRFNQVLRSDLLFELQSSLGVQLGEHIMPLPVELQDLLMVFPQTSPV